LTVPQRYWRGIALKSNKLDWLASMDINESVLVLIALQRLLDESEKTYKSTIGSLIKKIQNICNLSMNDWIFKFCNPTVKMERNNIDNSMNLQIIQFAVQNGLGIKLNMNSKRWFRRDVKITHPSLKFNNQWLVSDERRRFSHEIPIMTINYVSIL
jgi:hypothetical protein